MISNFTVKPYKTDDKYRPVQREDQLILSMETKIKEVKDKGEDFPTDSFGFYEHSELDELRKTTMYLIGMTLYFLQKMNYTNLFIYITFT